MGCVQWILKLYELRTNSYSKVERWRSCIKNQWNCHWTFLNEKWGRGVGWWSRFQGVSIEGNSVQEWYTHTHTHSLLLWVYEEALVCFLLNLYCFTLSHLDLQSSGFELYVCCKVGVRIHTLPQPWMSHWPDITYWEDDSWLFSDRKTSTQAIKNWQNTWKG